MSRTYTGGVPVGASPAALAIVDANVDQLLLDVADIDNEVDYIARNVEHTPRINGSYYFVNKNGADTNSGITPTTAFLTIGKALSVATSGDHIRVAAGTYVENGLELAEDGVEIVFGSGVYIAPSAGDGLLVSAAGCRINGRVVITAVAGSKGIYTTGTNNYLKDMRVSGGATGFHITGVGNDITDCKSNNPSDYGFDIQAGSNRFYQCSTIGSGASYGFFINAGSNNGLLVDCTSAGHKTSGFYIATSSSKWTLLNCSSGAGDGRWWDVDGVNVFSNFSYDSEKISTITFNGGGPASANLYRIYGAVQITNLAGHVHTVLSADIGNGYLNLYDGTVTVDLTDSSGPSFASLVKGSFIHKVDESSVNIRIEQANQTRLYEDTSKFTVDPTFVAVAKEGVATYIRFTYSGVATSGEISWHCDWKPLTHDGFVEVV